MDAHVFRAAATIAAVLSLGANDSLATTVVSNAGNSSRTEHFIVTAPTAEFARQVCQAAERYRRELALEWLGEPLPPWQSPCPIHVRVGPTLGAGGATSFAFVRGRPIDFRMTIQGSRARILDSVLPHEVTHMVMATHFGRPLPRWADEGAATTIEHVSERSKQDMLLVKFLTTERGIPFNHMFAMKEYPRDILPLYSQGYSLARYLIAQGGKRRFVQYVGDGMKWNNWTAATRKHYGYRSLSELQVTWLDWVRKGSPLTVPSHRPAATAVADSRTRGVADPKRAVQGSVSVLDGLVPLPGNSADLRQNIEQVAAVQPAKRTTTLSQGGWYSRKRDEALQRGNTKSSRLPPIRLPSSPGSSMDRQTARPQPPGRPGQVILQWSRNDCRQGVARR